MFAKVIVDIVHSGVDRVFEYRIPDELQIHIGYRVRVPFGKGNAMREGYVIGLSETCTYEGGNIKSVAAVLADFATFTPAQIRLAVMIRRYYHTTLASALRLMFPAEMRGGRVGDKFEREVVYELTDEEHDAAVAALKTKDGKIKAPKQLEVLETLRRFGVMRTAHLEKHVKGSAAPRDALVKKGLLSMRTVETLRNPRARSSTLRHAIRTGAPARSMAA